MITLIVGGITTRRIFFGFFVCSCLALTACAMESVDEISDRVVHAYPRSSIQYPSWLGFHHVRKLCKACRLAEEAKSWAAKGNLDLLFLGDSITETWRGTEGGKSPCIRCYGVPETFQELYGHINAAAFGIARDQTPHLLWRLQNGELPPGLQVKVVVVLVGTNDIGLVPVRSCNDTADGIRNIVAYVRATVPEAHVVPMAILPRQRIIHTAQAKTNPFRTNITAVNKILEEDPEWSADDHVHFLDCSRDFLDGHNAYIVRMLMPDFLHLSDSGHRKWAECLQPLLQNWLPGFDPSEEPDAAPRTADEL